MQFSEAKGFTLIAETTQSFYIVLRFSGALTPRYVSKQCLSSLIRAETVFYVLCKCPLFRTVLKVLFYVFRCPLFRTVFFKVLCLFVNVFNFETCRTERFDFSFDMNKLSCCSCHQHQHQLDVERICGRRQ